MLIRKRLTLCALLFSLAFLPVWSYAQDKDNNSTSVTPAEADKFFSTNDFQDALDAYLSLLTKYPKNELCNYRIAVCYLNTNIDKTKAIPYLELVAQLEKHNPNTLYLLGRAYQFAYRFDDAIKAFGYFKKENKGAADNLYDADVQTQNCQNAKELMKFPVNATFENLGRNINSPYDDYYPFVPADESFLVFNSKRPLEDDNKITVDKNAPAIYISTVKNGDYSPAVAIGPPIDMSGKGEEVVGLSAEGDSMLLYYVDKDGLGNICMSCRDSLSGFVSPLPLSGNINLKGQYQIAASVTADGNVIYFASDRPGGLGGIDIYSIRKLPNGNWASPRNLGPAINTASNEDFPNISPDGQTLYFSSQGHTGMGGYDIFKATLNDSTHEWGSVRNMGYPINTPDDDMNFRIATNGRYGYISQVRKGGYGGLDIYRLTFKDIESRFSLIKGYVASTDSSLKVKDYPTVAITIRNVKTQELYGKYIPNLITGRYVIILPPGKYNMSVKSPGYNELQEVISVEDKSSFQNEVIKNIILTPKDQGNH